MLNQPNFHSGWRESATRCASVCGVLLLLALPLAAPAADLAVDPISIQLNPQQQTVAIRISNNSDQPTSIQIQAVTWSQVDGKDVYAPTRELLVAPPIVTIAANSEQIVRAALRRQADPANELSYRIFLQELAGPPPPGFRGLQVALRIGLPVFVQPQHGLAAPKLTWSLSRRADNKLVVTLRNDGNAHVQVSDFRLTLPGSQKVIAGESASSYVLAGQTRSWELHTDPAIKARPAVLQLHAYTDAGEFDVALTAGTP